MTVSTPERVDLVQLVSLMLDHLRDAGDREEDRVFYTIGSSNVRLNNCRKVRVKLLQLIDESGVSK